jgi:hypothetical protein
MHAGRPGSKTEQRLIYIYRRPYMPTVADVESIAKTLGRILAGQPQRHGALTIIPILAPMQAEPEWITLAEARGSAATCGSTICRVGGAPRVRPRAATTEAVGSRCSSWRRSTSAPGGSSTCFMSRVIP